MDIQIIDRQTFFRLKELSREEKLLNEGYNILQVYMYIDKKRKNRARVKKKKEREREKKR